MTVVEPENKTEIGTENTLLVVDDDKPFLNRLVRAMELRGFAVRSAESVAEGMKEIRANPPAYAVVDMRLRTVTAWTWFSCCTICGRTAG